MKRHKIGQHWFTKQQASVAGLCAVLTAATIFAIPKKARAAVIPGITQFALKLEMNVFDKLSGVLGSLGLQNQDARRVATSAAAGPRSGEIKSGNMQLMEAMRLDLPQHFEPTSYNLEYHAEPHQYLSAGENTFAASNEVKSNREAAAEWATPTYTGTLAQAESFQSWGRAAGEGSGGIASLSSAAGLGGLGSNFDPTSLDRVLGTGHSMFATSAYGGTSLNRASALIYHPSRDVPGGDTFAAALVNSPAPHTDLMMPNEGVTAWSIPDVGSLLQEPISNSAPDTTDPSVISTLIPDTHSERIATSSNQLTSGALAHLPGQIQSDGLAEQNPTDTASKGLNDSTVVPDFPPPALSDPTQTTEPNTTVTSDVSDAIQDSKGQSGSKDSRVSGRGPSSDPGSSGSTADPPRVAPKLSEAPHSLRDPVATSEPSSLVFFGTTLLISIAVYKRRRRANGRFRLS